MGFFDSKSYSTSQQTDNRIAADGAATVIRVEDGSTVHLQQGIVPDTETGGWTQAEGALGDLLRFTQEQATAARQTVKGNGNQAILLLGAATVIAVLIAFKGMPK